MARAHWQLPVHNGPGAVFGCQHSTCGGAATHSWQRLATGAEISAESGRVGPYGVVVRNPEGPHRVAVFSCAEHALTADAMALVHVAVCPAPDSGCDCYDNSRAETTPHS